METCLKKFRKWKVNYSVAEKCTLKNQYNDSKNCVVPLCIHSPYHACYINENDIFLKIENKKRIERLFNKVDILQVRANN